MSVFAENEEECQGSDNTAQSLDLEQQDIGIEINIENKKLETSIAPELNLKKFLDLLAYVFLAKGAKIPAIISSHLSGDQKGRLVKVLKQHKGSIAWKVAHIKGINPSFCPHKIQMEDNFKPVVQPQRRLNLNMKEVVKAELIKLLDAGVIYPISNSAWVNPVQVVL